MPRRKKKDKKEAQRIHFEKRSLQRVGIILNRKEIIRKIHNQELEFIERQSNRVSLFRLIHEGTAYKVVYDKERKQIVTILYENWEKCEKN